MVMNNTERRCGATATSQPGERASSGGALPMSRHRHQPRARCPCPLNAGLAPGASRLLTVWPVERTPPTADASPAAPPPLARGNGAVGVAGGGVGILHVGHRLQTCSRDRFRHRLPQGRAQAHADRCDRPTADLHPEQLIKQRPRRAKDQRNGTAQQTHQCTETWSVRSGFHARRQGGAGAGGTTGQGQIPPIT
jgi:hypothetical protein